MGDRKRPAGSQQLLSKYFSVNHASSTSEQNGASSARGEVGAQSAKQKIDHVVVDLASDEDTTHTTAVENERNEKNFGLWESILAAEIEEDEEPQEDRVEGLEEQESALTPLEKQWKRTKEENPDVLLCVECGYKYRLFGEDAAVAAKILNIGAFKARAFLQTSFPVHRLDVHVRRLVQSGHKVGIVSQTETAALKKQSSTRNKLFGRQLTRIYSKATYIQEDTFQSPSAASSAGEQESKGQTLLSQGWLGEQQKSSSSTVVEDELPHEDTLDPEFLGHDIIDIDETERHLVFLWEVNPETGAPFIKEKARWGLGDPRPNAKLAKFGFIVADILSGGLSWDEFEDDEFRTLLRSRLSFFHPVELVVTGPTMSLQTEAVLEEFSQSAAPPTLDRVLFKDVVPSEDTQLIVGSFGHREDRGALFLGLPSVVQTVLALAIRHFARFGIEKLLLSCEVFPRMTGFSANTINSSSDETLKALLKIEESTLQDLDVFSDDSKKRFTITHFLTQHTETPMGHRMLRKWIMRPLAHLQSILDRQHAIEEVVSSKRNEDQNTVYKLSRTFRDLKRSDLERAIEKILHQRCSPNQFVTILHQVISVANALVAFEPESTILLDCATRCEPASLAKDLRDVLSSLSADAAEINDLANLFLDPHQYPSVFSVKGEIESLQSEFKRELQEIRQVLKQPSIKFRNLRTGISSLLEYLIELPRTTVVPSSWKEVSSTQRLARYVTPVVDNLLEQLSRRKEELALASRESWLCLQTDFASNFRTRLKRMCVAIATIDSCMALAKVAALPGYSRPKVVEGEEGAFVHATAARHPLLEGLDRGEAHSCVPNDIHIGWKHKDIPETPSRVQLVTGPNMGGKSTYVRTAALLVLLSQIGSYVPAETCTIGMFDSLIVRMGVKDNPLQGMSTFLVEMRQMADILLSSSKNSLCIADEVGRGTSTFDGLAIAKSSLDYICKSLQCPCYFITHYTSLADLQNKYPNSTLSTMHMSFLETHAQHQEIVFLYKAVPGVASKSYGINVARLAGLPEHIIEEAIAISNTTFL